VTKEHRGQRLYNMGHAISSWILQRLKTVHLLFIRLHSAFRDRRMHVGLAVSIIYQGVAFMLFCTSIFCELHGKYNLTSTRMCKVCTVVYIQLKIVEIQNLKPFTHSKILNLCFYVNISIKEKCDSKQKILMEIN